MGKKSPCKDLTKNYFDDFSIIPLPNIVKTKVLRFSVQHGQIKSAYHLERLNVMVFDHRVLCVIVG